MIRNAVSVVVVHDEYFGNTRVRIFVIIEAVSVAIDEYRGDFLLRGCCDGNECWLFGGC